MNNSSIIISIGGGEIDQPSETTLIDKEILRLTKSKSASMLFIPTASNDSQDYFQAVRQHFQKIGFSSVDVLNLIDTDLTKSQIKEIILSHQAIYVGGGNTLRMMKIWRKLGVDSILKQALDNGIVLSGLSAGSICWFSQGISDLGLYSNQNKKYDLVSGLDFISAIHCPHFSSESYYKNAIKTETMNSSKVAICLEDSIALVTVGNKYKIIKSKSTAKAFKAYWKDSEYYLEEILSDDSFKSLEDLLAK